MKVLCLAELKQLHNMNASLMTVQLAMFMYLFQQSFAGKFLHPKTLRYHVFQLDATFLH